MYHHSKTMRVFQLYNYSGIINRQSRSSVTNLPSTKLDLTPGQGSLPTGADMSNGGLYFLHVGCGWWLFNKYLSTMGVKIRIHSKFDLLIGNFLNLNLLNDVHGNIAIILRILSTELTNYASMQICKHGAIS